MTTGIDCSFWKLVTAIATIIVTFVGTPRAGRAFVLSLSGLLGDRSAVTDQATALYARTGSGRECRLAEVGSPREGVPALMDLGFPFVADDGSVLFAGMVAKGRRPRWIIFRADMQSTPPRISRVRFPTSEGTSAGPILIADPRPALDANGHLIFCAEDTGGKEAIFLFSNGELSPLVRADEKTQDGHRLTHIEFGSLWGSGPEEVVFVGWLENHKQAELIASKDAGVRVIAAEGAAAVGGGVFQQGFGMPATSPPSASAAGRTIAFTARTSVGQRAFVFHGGHLRRVDLSDVSCGKSPVTFLSTGRPALASGDIAVMGWCSDVPVILRIDDDERGRISFQADSLPGALSIGDPWMLDSGVVLFGGSTDGSKASIYELTTRGIVRTRYEPERDPWLTADNTESPEHLIYVATLAVNRHGDLAYLGDKARSN